MRRDRFTEIYRNNEWGSEETASGQGSERRATEHVVRIVDAAIIHTRARSMLDAGCGDRNWIASIRAPLDRYIGLDIVEALAGVEARVAAPDRWAVVETMAGDIVTDPLPRCDLILCRDVLQHLCFADIFDTIANFKRSGAAFLLATSPGNPVNVDIETGLWRPANLEAAPFLLPPPTKT